MCSVYDTYIYKYIRRQYESAFISGSVIQCLKLISYCVCLGDEGNRSMLLRHCGGGEKVIAGSRSSAGQAIAAAGGMGTKD